MQSLALQDYLHEHPSDGDVRVVYYLVLTQDVIIFLDVWAKNEKEDLTRTEYKILCDYLEGLDL